MTSPVSCIAHTWEDFSLLASALSLSVLLASALSVAALFVACLLALVPRLAVLQLVSIWPPLTNSSGCRFFRCTRLATLAYGAKSRATGWRAVLR